MDAALKVLFFSIALILFICEAWGVKARSGGVPHWGWVGLVFFTVPFLGDALSAT